MKKDKSRSVLSRADFTAMAEIGEKKGFSEPVNSDHQNLMRLNTIRVKDIMTPIPVVKAADQEKSHCQFLSYQPTASVFPIPVYKDSKDHINGFVLKDEVLGNIIQWTWQSPVERHHARDPDRQRTNGTAAIFNRLMEKGNT